ncbi:MAG: hypothetical protein M3384_02805 [Acidobacteriota bacterium]|nr:hypothetical protein [Acidobacteriota bacterium]
MTTSKKATGRKTTGEKTAKAKTPPKKSTNDFQKAYIRLRTVLDGFEIAALQYCLREETTKERIEHAKEVEELLMPIIAKLKDKPGVPPTSACAEGYYNCGGVCVPYQCPSDK